MPVVHLVAHLTVGSAVDICYPAMARRVWVFLRRGFPDVLCGNLMANHPHLIAEVSDVDWARHRMAKALAAAVRGFGRFTWEHLPAAEVLTTSSKVRRHMRYVTLNPCRARLVRDPLEWPWTTHRDLVGATIAPWARPERVARVLVERNDGFVERFHRYVSSDRDVAFGGTALPSEPEPSIHAAHSLDEIRLATLAATRGFDGDVSYGGFARDLFLDLARDRGWRDSRTLAEMCNVTPRSVRERQSTVRPSELKSALLCLTDRRLREGPWATIQPSPPSWRLARSLSEFREPATPTSRRATPQCHGLQVSSLRSGI